MLPNHIQRRRKMKLNWLTRKKNRFMAWAHKMFLKIKQKLNIKTYWGKAAQRHHDFWVFKYRQANGKLIPPDMEQYQEAMRRENKGKVKPLPEDATSPLG